MYTVLHQQPPPQKDFISHPSPTYKNLWECLSHGTFSVFVIIEIAVSVKIPFLICQNIFKKKKEILSAKIQPCILCFSR